MKTRVPTRLLFLSLALLALSASACERHGPEISPAPKSATAPRRPCLNLNTATAKDLEQLPGVGEVMARRVVEYRERRGPFRRPEEVIIIDGFSEKKYRAIADLICVE
ncbi:MAG TPA: helix-hairpin-helix domain-containing protein [Blastocatellia bacterium]|nr:helix-hairpin-helix domain-containing protein [Blastocatellia bacterium]